MIRVLGLGDNVCDVYLHTGTMYPGGQALNYAVYSKKLGLSSDFMGVFGQDAFADHIQNTLREKDIGFDHSVSYAGQNGFAKVTLIDGDRVFLGSNRGGVIQQHPIQISPKDEEYLTQFSHIHTTNNGFTDGLLPKLKKLPALISYDFSGRWIEDDRLARVCPYIDFAFLSCSDETEEDAKDICIRLHRMGCGTVVATRGSAGAVVYDGSQFYHQRPHLVEAIDSMGAGDSFASAMLAHITRKLDEIGREKWMDTRIRALILPQALDEAARFAASTCLEHGAFGCGIPLPEALYSQVKEISL